jgi:hypothetical protein
MRTLLDVLFGCPHKHVSFPRTARSGQGGSQAAALTGTYIVCLDCGSEFAYDWQAMKIISSRKLASTTAKNSDMPFRAA